jgi:acyl-[acyl-carrier-protein]-phospholipid O-acyltransferase/long-chain-fatty-acid--[acyl-carrier-protein] ligase
MIARLLHFLVRLLYGFRSYNPEPLRSPGPVLLLPNHVSWWDWIFIGVCLEEDWRFVTSSTTAALSWVHRKIMINRRTFPVDMTSPYAVRHMAEYLQQGGRLVLFPEGRISATGSLMKLFDGTGFLIAKTRPKVITAYVRGAQRLPFSRNSEQKQWFPRISVHFSEVLTPPESAHASATEARNRITDWLRERLVEQRFQTEMAFGPKTVPQAITLAARKRSGRVVVQDITLQEVTYRKLLVGAEVLAERWCRGSTGQQRVGVLLPNVNAMPVLLLSLWRAGKVPAVLNYTSGPASLLACARLAGLRQVITSRAFLARAGLEVSGLSADGIELVFLEDVRSGISRGEKLWAAARFFLSPPEGRRQKRQGVPPGQAGDEPAVVLFTSGSEGEPKGVELTHQNLLANIQQMLSVVDLMERDRFFNALPLFHSFGLTVGLLLPLAHGVFVFLYPSPLHYRIVPSAFYNLNCTVFFSTNTFLLGYARKAHPYDFRSLRLLFAGAEKLQESTSALWMRKFGVRVLEGYGTTECSPCLSANVPMNARPGSAGQLLPGVEFRLEHVEGIEDWQGTALSQAGQKVGRLLVRGPNVMRGYLNPEADAKFKALGGWYDTGDIARVEDDRFVYLLGRLKRFAKVSGEMVSLTAVEEAFAGAFPQYGLRFALAVVARKDEAKGERLIAVTNESRLTLEDLRQILRSRGLSNLAMPREIKWVRDIPRLGTGKVNHRELEKLMGVL